MSDTWQEAGGLNAPPQIGTLAWERWHQRLMSYYTGRVDFTPSATYYFSSTGSDAGAGTLGSPFKSPTKMQALIDAYDPNDDGLDIVLLPSKIWEDSADRNTVLLNKPRVRVYAYRTTGGLLPIFNRYDMKYESTGWSADTGTTYVRAEATSIEWLAEKYNWFDPLTKTTTLAECRSTLLHGEKGRWIQTGGNLYVNLGGINPNERFLEAAPTGQGCMFAISSDQCLVQDLITVGFFGVQAEGVQSRVTGTRCAVIRNVTCHGGDSHGGPTVLASTAGDTGGITLRLGCKSGGARYINGINVPTMFNAYTESGGQTLLDDRCEAFAGAMPLTTWTVPSTSTLCRSHGTAWLSHTNTGTSSLEVITNFRIGFEHSTYCSQGVSPSNTVAANGVLSAMRCFNVRQRLGPVPTYAKRPLVWPRTAGDNNDVSDFIGVNGSDDVVFFACQIRDMRGASSLAVPYVTTGAINGVHLLCDHEIIIRDPVQCTNYAGFVACAAKWWGCYTRVTQIKEYNDGITSFPSCAIALFETTNNGEDAEIIDGIIASDVETLTLNTGTISNNIYNGVTSTEYADDDDATAVVSGDLPREAAKLFYGGVIGTGAIEVNGFNIEVDFDGNRRSPIAGYDFGPWTQNAWPVDEGLTVSEAREEIVSAIRNGGGNDVYSSADKDRAVMYIGDLISMLTTLTQTLDEVTLIEDENTIDFGTIEGFKKDRLLEVWVGDDGDVSVVNYSELRRQRLNDESSGTPTHLSFTDSVTAVVWPAPDSDAVDTGMELFWRGPFYSWEPGTTDTGILATALNLPADVLKLGIRFLGIVALQFKDPEQIRYTDAYKLFVDQINMYSRPAMGSRTISRRSIREVRTRPLTRADIQG